MHPIKQHDHNGNVCSIGSVLPYLVSFKNKGRQGGGKGRGGQKTENSLIFLPAFLTGTQKRELKAFEEKGPLSTAFFSLTFFFWEDK